MMAGMWLVWMVGRARATLGWRRQWNAIAAPHQPARQPQRRQEGEGGGTGHSRLPLAVSRLNSSMFLNTFSSTCNKGGREGGRAAGGGKAGHSKQRSFEHRACGGEPVASPRQHDGMPARTAAAACPPAARAQHPPSTHLHSVFVSDGVLSQEVKLDVVGGLHLNILNLQQAARKG